MVARILGTLSAIVFLRVLGVSLLLAGFIHHGESLGGTVAQSGLAFGAYPLALALFMLPLAALSDHIGRRTALAWGLGISALGGIVAAAAPTVLLLAIGRFIQGAGAVNGIALAVAGEIGPPEKRARRMAILGASAGGGFAVGIVLGALLDPLLGVPGLLVIHSALQLALLVPVLRTIPATARDPAAILSDTRMARPIWWLGGAAFFVNFSLTGLLFLSPLLIAAAVPDVPYWLIITLMVLPGGLGMFLAARMSDRGHTRAVGLVAATLLALAPLPFLGDPGIVRLIAAGIAFFIGHSALTALVPALVATFAPEQRRGAAQGIQSTLQYGGSFVGAALVGILYPNGTTLAAAFLIAGFFVAVAMVAVTRRKVR